MSTVKTNNLQAVAGGSVVPIADVINGVARAWVNFNGTGVVAIQSSYNVASITDNGSGDYTVNFSAALADANYCVSGVTTSGPAGISVAIHAPSPSSAPTAMTTTACRIYASNTGGALDVHTTTIVFHR